MSPARNRIRARRVPCHRRTQGIRPFAAASYTVAGLILRRVATSSAVMRCAASLKREPMSKSSFRHSGDLTSCLRRGKTAPCTIGKAMLLRRRSLREVGFDLHAPEVQAEQHGAGHANTNAAASPWELRPWSRQSLRAKARLESIPNSLLEIIVGDLRKGVCDLASA